MSTGLNCTLEETAPGVWYYVLETGDGPRNAWDWREYAEAYGPFPNTIVAAEHLHRNHANPGGYSLNRFEHRTKPVSSVLAALIEKARKP